MEEYVFLARDLIRKLAQTADPDIISAAGIFTDGADVIFTAVYRDGGERLLCLHTDGDAPLLTGCAAVRGIPSDADGIPLLDAEQVGALAEEFLMRHYPDALFSPLPLPIWSLLTQSLGLTVCDTYNLTRDFSILGRLCIAPTPMTVYRHDGLRTEEHIIGSRGTVFIDSRLRLFRSNALQITLAHEAAHWLWHRAYFNLLRHLNTEPTSREPEIQADRLAEALLLPVYPFTQKALSLPPKSRIRSLASFYAVPPQVVERRLKALDLLRSPSEEPPLTAREVFDEYLRSEAFRAVVNSGALRFAEGRCIVDSEKYVIPTDFGLRLTEAAKNDPESCTLKFVPAVSSGIARTGEEHRIYAPQLSGPALSDPKVMTLMKRQFEDDCRMRTAGNITFWQKLWQYIRLRNMNSAVFAEKTLLDESYYRHAQRNDGKALPEVRTVVAMCVGLGLDLPQSQELLRLAGRALNDSREHVAYGFVLSMLRGQSIYDCNTFLAEVGVRPLGAKGGM